jgi:malonyl-CoA O-methyltransferase
MAVTIRIFGLPVVIVARSSLGTINHTLLTLEALRRRMERVAGVIMVGEPNADNREAIEKFGDVRVLAEMPPLDPLDPATLAAWSVAHLDPAGVLLQYLR